MRIGIRAHDVAYAPLEELIPNIHAQGFHCMHIALSKSIKEFKPGVETMTPGLAMYIKELCTENKVDVAVLGCYLNLCNPNPEKHKEIVEKYKAHIRFASILGCGVVGTETGAVNEEYKYEPANHSEEALQCFIDNLRPIVKYAEQFGVIVAIEPVWKHIVYTVERARKVLDAIDSPNLQIIFDPVNLLCVDNLAQQDEIIEKAKEEGEIASVGMPADWANWKGSWEAFTEKYGIAHEDTDMSSAEELSTFDTEKDAPTKDMGDVGQAFGPTAMEMDVVQPYKASTWDSIPDWAKDPDGNWVITYLGTMSCMQNNKNVDETIDSWKALADSDCTVTIGDVVRGASSQMAVLSCAYALGGDLDNLDPAFEFFEKLAKEGRLDAGAYSQERMERNEIDVLLTWDYLTLQYRDLTLETVPEASIDCHVMKDGAIQSGYCLVINKYAPHPYSAALAVEYLLSDEGQIDRAKGYARPIRSDVELPEELQAKMIDDAEYTDMIPMTDNDAVTEACTEIASRWEEEIIPLMN